MSTRRPSVEFTIQVEVEPDGDEFHAYAPALKGLHVSGRTEAEALRNAVDAAEAYLESLLKHGDPIPLGVEVKGRSPGTISTHRERLNVPVPA